jgi:hypothetical protein
MTWFRIRRKEKHHGVKQYKLTPQELLTQSLIKEEPGQPVTETPTPEPTSEPTPAPTPAPAPVSPAPAPAPAEPQISPAEINLEPALKLREEELQSLIALKDEKVAELANNTELTETQKYEALIKTLTTTARAANKHLTEQFPGMATLPKGITPITWQEIGVEQLPPGVMGQNLLPYARGKDSHVKSVEEDKNLPILIHKVQEALESENITDDQEGTDKLFEIVSDKTSTPLRELFNSYFEQAGRENFQNLIKLAGYPNVAEFFKNYSTKELNYRDIKAIKKQGAEVKVDEVFKDYGLDTRSEAERQILSIFRSVNLQPIPAEIKMPSTKVKKGTANVNTEFMCDFLLPCEVLKGWNQDGSPNIQSQVVFVGEYFGWYGKDYEDKTSMKEELEPFQAVLTGNDVIFITKTDFEKGGNPLKLINQLEAKGIIYKGGTAKEQVDAWLDEHKTSGRYTPDQVNNVENRVEKLTPEQSIVRTTKLQLQFKFGELKNFYQKYADETNPEFQQLSKNIFEQYRTLKAQADDLNKQIRAIQHRSKIAIDDKWSWKTQASKLSPEGKSLDELMDELRNVNLQIRNAYVQNDKINELKLQHETSLQSDTDYLARLQDLDTLENMLENNKDPMPEVNVSIGKKVATICNNALTGLGVSLTRESPKKGGFEPMLRNSIYKFLHRIKISELDLLLK